VRKKKSPQKGTARNHLTGEKRKGEDLPGNLKKEKVFWERRGVDIKSSEEKHSVNGQKVVGKERRGRIGTSDRHRRKKKGGPSLKKGRSIPKKSVKLEEIGENRIGACQYCAIWSLVQEAVGGP